MTSHTQRWIRIIILTVGLVTALCMVLVPYVGRRALRRDYAEAVPRQGVATVVLLVEERVDIGRDVTYPPKVLVRFQGDVYRVRSVTDQDIAGIEVNQSVQITYRIGKSGRLYVDSFRSLPATARSAFRR